MGWFMTIISALAGTSDESTQTGPKLHWDSKPNSCPACGNRFRRFGVAMFATERYSAGGDGVTWPKVPHVRWKCDHCRCEWASKTHRGV